MAGAQQMRVGLPAAGVAAVVLLATACAQAPVTPIREEARRNVAAISGDVSGLKYADTSRLGARGSGEGAQLGAQQGASLLPGAGGLLGLAVLGLAPSSAASRARAKPSAPMSSTRPASSCAPRSRTPTSPNCCAPAWPRPRPQARSRSSM